MSILEKLFGAIPQPGSTATGTSGTGDGTNTGTKQELNSDGTKVAATDSEEGKGDEGTKSPLDQFTKLFAPDENKKQEENNPFALDPTKLRDSARGIDFTKQISSETLEQISAGGEGAQAAFLKAMNEVAQANYAYAAMLATKTAERAVQTTLERVNTLVPDLVRKMRTDEEFSSNPALNHPAAKPLIQALIPQFASKYPDASPKELKQMASEYLQSFGKLFQSDEDAGLVDKTKTKRELRQPQETDWSQFLSN